MITLNYQRKETLGDGSEQQGQSNNQNDFTCRDLGE